MAKLSADMIAEIRRIADLYTDSEHRRVERSNAARAMVTAILNRYHQTRLSSTSAEDFILSADWVREAMERYKDA